MNETQAIELHEDIPADWRVVTGMLEALLFYGRSLNTSEHPDRLRHPGWSRSLPGDDLHFSLITSDINARPVADIWVKPSEKRTHLHIKTTHGHILVCRRIVAALHVAVKSAQEEREAEHPTADSTIELYYRRKAAGAKVTLRQLAQESDYSYEYLKKAKQRYDAAGKWGSKKKGS